jgi:hypothetical protein
MAACRGFYVKDDYLTARSSNIEFKIAKVHRDFILEGPCFSIKDIVSLELVKVFIEALCGFA